MSAPSATQLLARCVECGTPIDPEEPEAWWGTDRVHLDCGEAAWQREWPAASQPTMASSEH